MTETYGFLAALDLDATADARAIRRAYARKLKTIDQQADGAGFQALREAYETALEWAAYAAQEEKEAKEADAAVTAPPPKDAPATPTVIEEEPHEDVLPEETRLANAVWDRFCEGRQALLETHRLGDPEAWHDLLRARLQDDELINIGARMEFEWRIVYILGNGWQPGHEALFPAAVAAFDWESDRRRLAQFDYYGNLLNSAIDERALFDSQAIAVRSVQERIAMLLRREQQADAREIVQSMAELRKMQSSFPALLLVVANAENVAYWEAESEAYAEADQPVGPSKREIAARWYVRTIAVVVAFFALRALYNETLQTVPEQPPRAASSAAQDKGQRYDPHANPPTQALLEQHMAPVRFEPEPGALPGNYTVEMEVFLDAEGKVIGINKLQESQLAGFDEAIEAALRASKPFPQDTARIFRVSMYGHIGPKTPAPRRPGATTQV